MARVYISGSIGPYVKLGAEENPTFDDEKVEMAKFSYASAIGSFMYAMVATHREEVVSRYIAIANPGKKHWETSERYYGIPQKHRICGSALESRKHLSLALQMQGNWLCGLQKVHSGLLYLQATEVCCIVYYRNRVCGCY